MVYGSVDIFGDLESNFKFYGNFIVNRFGWLEWVGKGIFCIIDRI